MEDNKRYQFGRLCTLEFTNFTTKKKFTIDQNLRIGFEFTKQFDESTSSSTGEIVIYGLTSDTANRLGTRIKDMFQTEVECKVGYSGDPDNVQTLFYATVLNNQWFPTRGSSETRIRVSANFRDFYLGQLQRVNLSNTTLGAILNEITNQWGFTFSVDLSEISQISGVDGFVVGRIFDSFPVLNWSFTGNIKDYLRYLYHSFGFLTRYTKEDNTIHFKPLPQFVSYYVDMVKKTPEEISKYKLDLNKVEPLNNYSIIKSDIASLYTTPKDSKIAYVFTWDSGLLEIPTVDNRNVVVPYDQTLASNEVLVKRKVIKPVLDKKTGEHKKDKDGNLRYTKPPKTMTINRRFLSAKVQLNPSIKPDAIIVISTGYPSVDGQYRVRDCKYIGDTHEGDWAIEMQLEDTFDTREEDVGSLPTEQEETIEVITNNDVDTDGGGDE